MTNNTKNTPYSNMIRIIAGRYRGRKLKFAGSSELRPTADRVKETVFNWIQSEIVDSNCLDLFAGSGSLGFEAISRGAKWVTMVEKEEKALLSLKSNKKILQADNLTIAASDVNIYLAYLAGNKFDIVFMDPPFMQAMVNSTLEDLFYYDLINDTGRIYIECHIDDRNSFQLPIKAEDWYICSEKKAGNVCYMLLLKKNKEG